MMHSAHQDKPESAILADDCERCEQHASHPFDSLDDGNLGRLILRYISRPLCEPILGGLGGSTVNDYRALQEVEHHMRTRGQINRLVDAISNNISNNLAKLSDSTYAAFSLALAKLGTIHRRPASSLRHSPEGYERPEAQLEDAIGLGVLSVTIKEPS